MRAQLMKGSQIQQRGDKVGEERCDKSKLNLDERVYKRGGMK